jgi:hypothetical protein
MSNGNHNVIMYWDSWRSARPKEENGWLNNRITIRHALDG